MKSNPSDPLYPEQKLLLGGEWKTGESLQQVHAPFDGKLLGSVWKAGEKESNEAIEKAVTGFQSFRKTPTHVRRNLLLNCAKLIDARHNELVDILSREAGKPVMFSSMEVKRMRITFELAAAELTRFGGEMLPVDFDDRAENCECIVKRFPIGVVAAIVPYNWPFNLAAHKIAPALAVGNTLIVKPASSTPLSTLALGKILVDAGVPPNVVSILPCSSSIAQKWVEDDRMAMVSFTGSPPVGWRLKAIAGKKKVALELGGNAALVVHEDADIDRAVQRAVIGGFGYAGQVCIAIQRIFVHQPVYENFKSKLVEATKNCPYGDPLDSKTVSGPVIDSGNAERIETWINEAVKAGARVLVGGKRQGTLIPPTILDQVKPEMKVCAGEIFGPVVTLEPYQSWSEVLKKVNDSEYGLQAGVFTNDANRIHEAFQHLDVGGVIANDFPTMRVDNFPYGGIKNSGFGREGVKYTMEEMTELKTLFTRYRSA